MTRISTLPVHPATHNDTLLGAEAAINGALHRERAGESKAPRRAGAVARQPGHRAPCPGCRGARTRFPSGSREASSDCSGGTTRSRGVSLIARSKLLHTMPLPETHGWDCCTVTRRFIATRRTAMLTCSGTWGARARIARFIGSDGHPRGARHRSTARPAPSKLLMSRGGSCAAAGRAAQVTARGRTSVFLTVAAPGAMRGATSRPAWAYE